ncbi:hypothetical protein [Kitasatospora purpeofusca]|uniref:Transposase InsH N-terminal domain-containing protein n=1 Tax=Kitasatospora purpeofusca TaxID=67352 RepID=A0ABZ1UBM8_9ACTN|nr:hypothetical protein [Kitasatospora purpeofusca]
MITLFHELNHVRNTFTLAALRQIPDTNPKGTTAMWVRDRLDGLWHDEDFADWYPRDGRPGLSPAQLATVCVLQFLLGLSDRCSYGCQAAVVSCSAVMSVLPGVVRTW